MDTGPMLVRDYLAAYVRRRRRAAVGRAAGWAVAAAGGGPLVACGIDRVVPLPAWVRLTLLVVTIGLPIGLLGRPAVRWARRRFDLIAAAAEVERQQPAFAHQLVTAVSPGGSADLRAAVGSAAAATCAAVGPAPVGRRPAVMAWVVAGLTLAAAAGLWRWSWLDLPDLSRRLLRPTAGLPAVTATRLHLRPGPTAVPDGRPLVVTVDRVAGSAGVVLHVSDDEGRTWARQPMVADGGAFTATVPVVDRDLRYFATADDAVTPTAAVRVRRPPAVVAVRVRYEYPPAADRVPLTVADADGQIVAPAGTAVTLDVTATEPLRSATLAVNGTAVPTRATPDRRVRRGRFVVTADGRVEVRLTAADGTVGQGPTLRVTAGGRDDVAGFEAQQRAYRAAIGPP